MATEKTCFIIMPISTPEAVQCKYRDKADHFAHVLECLITASVKKAGFTPIPPVAEGADLIHAEIIKYLESADLVLCDTSALNANVFFEFGIRCALNKPVCIIKDDMTEKVPFDTGILNHHKYKSTLEPWELPAEIDSLVKHIDISVRKCKDTNPLWKYFGAKSEAAPAKGGEGDGNKFDMLFMQMDALRQQLNEVVGCVESGPTSMLASTEEVDIWLRTHFSELDFYSVKRTEDKEAMVVIIEPADDVLLKDIHLQAIRRFGIWLSFIVSHGKDRPPSILLPYSKKNKL